MISSTATRSVACPTRPASCSTPSAAARTRRSTGIPSGGGVPSWMAGCSTTARAAARSSTFGPIEGEDRDRLAVPVVRPHRLRQSAPGRDDDPGHRRRRDRPPPPGIEPGRGWWAQPGGFLEVDETVGEAAVRETLEETGLIVEPGEIVGLYSRLEAAVVVLAFEARVVGGTPRLNPEALEIQAFAPEAIPWPGIAFKTSHWAIRDWLHRRRPDIHPADRHWDE